MIARRCVRRDARRDVRRDVETLHCNVSTQRRAQRRTQRRAQPTGITHAHYARDKIPKYSNPPRASFSATGTTNQSISIRQYRPCRQTP